MSGGRAWENGDVSSSLYWKPAPKDEPHPEDLPYELKKAIARRYWDHDGSLNGDEILLGAADLPYLQGLVDGGVTGASELLAAVCEHGAVILWIAN